MDATLKPELRGYEKWAVLYLASLGFLPNILIPFDVMSIMKRFGLSEENVGWLASAQLLVLSLTAMLMTRWISEISKRKWCLASCVLSAAAMTGMLLAKSVYLYAFLKLGLGLALGILVVCCYSLASRYRNPERMFAQVAVVMAILYGAAMYAIPLVVAQVGPLGSDLVQLFLLLPALALAPGMPVAIAKIAAKSTAIAKQAVPRGAWWMLLSIFAMFISQTVTLSFAGPASHPLSVTDEDLGVALTVAALAQIPAAMVVNWLGGRIGYFKPICLGIVMLIAVAVGMYEMNSKWTFFVAISMINAGVVLANPYMVTVLAQIDGSGRSAALAGSVTNIGLAIGPALASLVFGRGGVQPVGWLAAGLLLISFVAALGTRMSSQRADAASVCASDKQLAKTS